MRNKRTFITWKILFAALLLLGAQNVFAQSSAERYQNTRLKVAFQTPENSTRDKSSTDERVIFVSNASEVGSFSRFEFTNVASEIPEGASELLGTERGFNTFIDGAVSALNKEMKDMSLKITEKKRVKIAGLNGAAIFMKAKKDGIKLKAATFSVPVREHRRLYIFTIIALEENFDKWLPVAQASIDSFELLKSVH